ncbi:hypothetical protein [Georgenia sp. SYP-B2076]|uniref:hypothetical protein n=1 Tax=Georgenia sp. SYP-B2076 TaxID=2495881 RepID=UPI0013DF73B0|nr:hypothetical protein [Georgenia sp. SYP-B2076]
MRNIPAVALAPAKRNAVVCVARLVIPGTTVAGVRRRTPRIDIDPGSAPQF